MKQIMKNIGSVAKYESKLLVRSWFFRIFIVIALALCAAGLYYIQTGQFGIMFKKLDSLIPYGFNLIMNVVQSFIIVFLSADYLKRDKQLDTSEVFYVRPLTNAEYLLGKVWGTIRPFIVLDLILMCVVFGVSRFAYEIPCSPIDFIIYFLIITIPSLIFFTGISTALMLVIGNQAITYIVVLGLSVMSLMYVGQYADFIFDMFLLKMPMAQSEIQGFSNLPFILSHRLVYIILGLASIVLSIALFKRLASSKRIQRRCFMISIVLFILGGLAGANYIWNSYTPDRVSARMKALNGEYADYPKLKADNYVIEVEQQPRKIKSKMSIEGELLEDAQELIFNLNGGMNLKSVTMADGTPLNFKREQHIIVVELKSKQSKGDKLAFNFEYDGDIDENEMFIDIDNKMTHFKNLVHATLNYNKRCAFIEPKWLMLTPESGWYVRPGVTYSDTNVNWRQDYFSNYKLTVKPLEGMVPVSQGDPVVMADSVTYSFAPEIPLRAVSLAISDYERYHIEINDIDYSVYLHKENTEAVDVLRPVADTLRSCIEDEIGNLNRRMALDYTLPRLTLVDAPVDMYCYQRDWSSTQELAQPELIFVPGAGKGPAQSVFFGYNVAENFENQKRFSKYSRQKLSDQDMRLNVLRNVFYTWTNKDMKRISYDAGEFQSTDVANPHYLPTILFNSKYNLMADSLPWLNQLLEMYYLDYDNLMTRDYYSRWIGMSDLEQVLTMLEKKGCNEYMSDNEYSKYNTELIMSQGNVLFAEAMSHMDEEDNEFMDVFKALIDSSEYKNLNISELLDSISVRSGHDVRNSIKNVNKPIERPYFYIGNLKSERGFLFDEQIYCVELEIQNLSDVKGYVEVIYSEGQDKSRRVIELLPHQIKKVVKHAYQNPRVDVNTMNSANIPQYMMMGAASMQAMTMMSAAVSYGGGGGRGGRMPGGGRGMMGGMRDNQEQQMMSSNVIPEGEYILDHIEIVPDGEIIVDNEDSTLFSVSAPPSSGYLNTWIDNRMENPTKYKNVNNRIPYKWTLTSGTQYYGTYIFSSLAIKGGDGSQFVEWKIPVERGERYAIYFSTTTPLEIAQKWRRRNNKNKNLDLTYDFKIDNGHGDDDVTYNFKNMTNNRNHNALQWEWLGDYNADQDTIVVKLTNKSKMLKVSADAVKAVNITRN